MNYTELMIVLIRTKKKKMPMMVILFSIFEQIILRLALNEIYEINYGNLKEFKN